MKGVEIMEGVEPRGQQKATLGQKGKQAHSVDKRKMVKNSSSNEEESSEKEQPLKLTRRTNAEIARTLVFYEPKP